MADEHVTKNNPNGSVEQCNLRKVHEPHEWQAEFGAYFDVYCPGIQVPETALNNAFTRARYARSIAWDEGYQACKRGDKPNNPYLKGKA